MRGGEFRFLSFRKKGMSSVIVTLLLVMLSIVIVGVVFVLIVNLVNSESKNAAFQNFCVSSGVEVPTFSCSYDGSECNVSIKRTFGNDKIGGVRLTFANDAGDSNVYDVQGDIITLATKKVPVKNIGVTNISNVGAIIYLNDSSGSPEVCPSSGLSTATSSGTTSGSSTSGSGGGGGGSTSGTSCTATSCPSGEYCDTNTGACTTSGTSCTATSCPSGEYCDTNTGACTAISSQCTPASATFCADHNYQCGVFGNGSCSGTITCGISGTVDGCKFPNFCNKTYQCEVPKLLNNGTIYSAWPTDAPIFFDSEDLPKNQTLDLQLALGAQYEYEDSFVRFPDKFNNPNCTQIAYITYQNETNRSFVALTTSPGYFANISAGDQYRIWNTYSGCVNDTVT